ncbi:hypothetical protein APX70_200320 [Pseudomonas syringae pv. maculicola]|uniref:Uncharacterized protein n=1 Tax=Pseudomonas syringae pv. maculicola TaxID=59511 RepID=A0A3M2WNT6_PSEYM|nr:hypothetical protein APX70_200320 [Pseudomonas syringae pv. maculicola]
MQRGSAGNIGMITIGQCTGAQVAAFANHGLFERPE